jgi:cytochrome bd-type quinol oxidase subunit 1
VNVPGVPGVSGSGNLAILHFYAVGSSGSSSAIDLSNGFLNDNMGTEILATWASHSVEVSERTANASSPMPKLLIAAPLGAVVVGGSMAYLWMRRREAQHRM